MGKGRQAAKTEIERLKLGELSCEQGVTEVAKMCGAALLPHPRVCVRGVPQHCPWCMSPKRQRGLR